MSSSSVICLGELLYDYLANQLEQVYSSVISWTAYPGGAPANVACALVKLGTPAAFIGCIGKDAPGNELVQVLHSQGVETSGIQVHQSAITPRVYVLRSEDGDRFFAGFGDYIPSQFAHAYIQSSQLSSNLFSQAQYLVIGTLCYAYPDSAQAIDCALDLAAINQLKVILDVNWRPMFWPDPENAKPLIKKLLVRANFVKLSDQEAEWLFDTTDAREIFAQLNTAQGVIVTAGSAPVNYCFGSVEGQINAFSFQSVDTTGAGDSFLAGFIHQLCHKGAPSLLDPVAVKEIITYACVVGGLTTLSEGAITAQPTASEVETFLKNTK